MPRSTTPPKRRNKRMGHGGEYNTPEHRGDNGAHVPSLASMARVRQEAGHGLTLDEIATIIGISPQTLSKRYKKEIDQGRAIAKSQVTRTAFRMATDGRHPESTWKWLSAFGGVSDKGSSDSSITIVVNTGIVRPGDEAIVIDGEASDGSEDGQAAPVAALEAADS